MKKKVVKRDFPNIPIGIPIVDFFYDIVTYFTKGLTKHRLIKVRMQLGVLRTSSHIPLHIPFIKGVC